MKKNIMLLVLGLFAANTYASPAQTVTTPANTAPALSSTQQQPASPQMQQQIQMAQKGCQKPLGYFPTPSKIICVLTAIGKTQHEIKPKAIAVIFGTCQGHSLTTGTTGAKKYATLGSCLSDPNAVTTINKELAAQGFPAVSVVNPSVLVAK